ncbi:hypothetical protein HPB47_019873 [Ixodes persulcatus]|uniref:Uncharacterized protein n=1 Tax=Ixodes persulcatus TaxID=34615 RepID=A0AC60QH17_IXOPE|nr:hypothetical protein HPB47_019873 [Ixodes persulcatus]
MTSLELPLTRKDLLPKGRRDRTLFIVMTVMTPAITLFELLVVLPQYHDSIDALVCLHSVLAVFIVVNILGNMYRVIQIGTGVRDSGCQLPAVLLPGWRYCPVCQVNAPPRSHHCNVCDQCILKHDHHCMFAGRCVGFFNQRYFVMGLVYIFFGTLYSLIYQLDYCVASMGGMRLFFLLGQLAPHFGWLLGVFGWRGFFCSTLNLFQMLTVALSGYMLVVQAQGIWTNQTTYERRHGIVRYHAGLRRNLREALGTSWYLVWLGPWVRSPALGDGLRFDNGIEALVEGKRL